MNLIKSKITFLSLILTIVSQNIYPAVKSNDNDLEAIKQSLNEQKKQLTKQIARIDQMQNELDAKTNANNSVATKENNSEPNYGLTTSITHSEFVNSNDSLVLVNQPVDLNNSTSVLNGSVTHSNFVVAGKKADLKITGQIDEAMVGSNDGQESDLFFVTNDNSPSLINVSGLLQANDDFSLKSQIELGFKVNLSTYVSQSDPTPSPTIDERRIEMILDSKRLGKIWFGKGSTASDGTAEVDLSGTDIINESSVYYFGGGLYFRNDGDADTFTTHPQVYDAFDNLDGLGRKNRIRYDTPSLYGFSLGASAIEANRQDVALKYDHNFGKTEIAGAFAFATKRQRDSLEGVELVSGKNLDGSLSILFPCGINITGAGGKIIADTVNRDDPNYYYAKLGYQKQFFNFGKTAVSIDYGKYNDFALNDDRGTTYSADLVQNISKWDFAVYAGFRNYELDRVDTSYNRINLYILGAILKF